MPDAILALNAGSSSVKFALFEVGEASLLKLRSKGGIEGIGVAPHLVAKDAAGSIIAEQRWPAHADHEKLLGELLAWVESHLNPDNLVAVGHRVVHGGAHFIAPIRLTPDVIDALDRLTPLAPLHQPHSLSPVRALMTLRPGLAQVACFDTAFHSTLPPVATRFALPREYRGRRRPSLWLPRFVIRIYRSHPSADRPEAGVRTGRRSAPGKRR